MGTALAWAPRICMQPAHGESGTVFDLPTLFANLFESTFNTIGPSIANGGSRQDGCQPQQTGTGQLGPGGVNYLGRR